MMSQGLPTFYLAGFQKCASTWLHRCFLQREDIYVPDRHMLHYFDVNWTKGESWYRQWFTQAREGQLIGDTTVSYARDPQAMQRLHDHCPQAKLIFLLRNPIDRAFSHYWHEKRVNKISHEFKDLFENYDLFQSWVLPGFYAQHIHATRQIFPVNQVAIYLVDDIEADPLSVWTDVCKFLNVPRDPLPEILDRKANSDQMWKRELARRGTRQQSGPADSGLLTRAFGKLGRIKRKVVGGEVPVKQQGEEPTEYDRGMDPQVRRQLVKVFEQPNRQLETMLGRSLNAWEQESS